MAKLSRQKIASELFNLANMLAGEKTGHLASIIHGVVSDIWEIDKRDPELFDIAANGNQLIPMEEFKTACASGKLTDSDGYGFLTTAKKRSHCKVYPSAVQYSAWDLPGWATHVLWIETKIGNETLKAFDKATALYSSLPENDAMKLRASVRKEPIERILYRIQNEFLPGLSDTETQDLFWYVRELVKAKQ